MATKARRAAGNKRVPWWVTMDMTPLFVVVVIAWVLGLTALLGRATPRGSIHACVDAYAAAHSKEDTARVDAQRPFDTPRIRGASCGSLRGTAEYVRMEREQREHATRAVRRGHA